MPTLGAGETYTDLLADRSAFEDFDVDAQAAKGGAFVQLNQLALEHLMGVTAVTLVAGIDSRPSPAR